LWNPRSSRQTDPEHIPRPRNAFILFRKQVVDSKLIPTSVEMRHQNVSIITAKMWAEVSATTHHAALLFTVYDTFCTVLVLYSMRLRVGPRMVCGG
jgi:hypothetical protein